MNYHLRKGNFGKEQQHMERKINDLIEEIVDYSTGTMNPVKSLTYINGRLLKKEKIIQIVEEMIKLNTDITDKKEKEFYCSYLYCALVLMSLEFTYIPEDDPETDKHGITYPTDLPYIHAMTLNTLGRYFTDEAWYWSNLYYVLSGEEASVPFLSEEEPEIDPEDLEEMFEYDMEHYDEIMSEEMELNAEYDSWIPMTIDEAMECNNAEQNRIRSFFDGIDDFIKHTNRYIKLSSKYLNEDCVEKVKEMAEYYMLSEGYSLYKNEKDYMDILVRLIKIRKLLAKFTEVCER